MSGDGFSDCGLPSLAAIEFVIATRDEAGCREGDLLSELGSPAALRWLLEGGPTRLTPRAAHLLALRPSGGTKGAITEMIHAGRLILIQRRIERPIPPSRLRKRFVAAPLTAPPPAPKQTAWIKLQVVHHITGEPFVGVRLAMRIPSGLEMQLVTDRSGMVTIDDIDSGSCEAWCELADARLDRTIAYEGLGKPPPREIDPSQPRIRTEWGAPAEWLAQVEEHKVRSGETLKSIAEANGLTWQQLAAFNWDTSEPDEVNKHLRDDVGCTHKTPDGFNYQLNDDDEPGLIYVPKQWRLSGLATDETHVLRAKLPAGVRLVLENQDGLRIPEAEYEATFSDGSKKQGRLGRAGMSLLKDPPPGPVEIVYTDLDDVQAKSLATCARRAMDERDLGEIFRVLKHSREMLRGVVAAYERYFNDYTGNGLLADIEQEVTDPDDRAAIEALLRIAALHSEPGDASGSAEPAEAV